MPPDPVHPEPAPEGPRYTVAAVARRLGVAPATLRTWDRRYELGPSEHAPGAHRRYSPADVARLEQMRRLTLDGVAPADAAALVLADTDTDADAPPPAEAPVPRGPGGPGGRVLAVPGGEPRVRGLARAAMTLDADAVQRCLRESLAEVGVRATWTGLVSPVLVAAGSRWASTGDGVEVEHLLSECTAAAMREVVAAAPPPRDTRPVLLASAEADQHSLPLHALAAALAEQRVASRVLGASMPALALAAAVRRVGPAALFVWSQLPATADTAALDAIPVTRPRTVLLVGGPGWREGTLPGRVGLCTSLDDAVARLSDSVGVPAA